jgi:heterodisulfide reductase subunit A
VNAGSIVVATGFDAYPVGEDELGYGLDGVIALPDFKQLVESNEGTLEYQGKPVKNIVYIYCVGSRQDRDAVDDAHEYCSRYCCTAAVHASLEVAAKPGHVHQYHLHRDIRTYGKYEKLYDESLNQGSVYLKVPDDEPPTVVRDPETGRLLVTTRDLLSEGEEIEILADLVVLVTGMVPRENEDLTRTLKLPIGKSGFFNEIHPKLRPVETVVDGVYICGTCQQPMNSAEAVASGLAAVTQSASILKRGFAELDPLVAMVDTDACTWCGLCLEACPYAAPQEAEFDGKAVALIDKTTCKGCGGCVPVCPVKAIDLEGYTNAQIRAMIDGMLSAPPPAPLTVEVPA